MKKMEFSFVTLIAIIISIFSSSLVLSRTLTFDTQTLDVSSTISKTQDLFTNSLNSQNVLSAMHDVQQHTQPLSSPNSPLTFQLHSRFSIRETIEKDYNTLTLTRLTRDSHRVKSIQTRLALSTLGIKKSDLTPLQSELDDQKLKGPITSGASQGSGEYFCRVGIGNPPTQSYMVLDTGSDINWVQCAPCADCYQQSDPIFNPESSSSYNTLTCSAHQCRSLDVSDCRNDTCLYEVSYGDGSYTVGDFATESISFGESATVENVAIGCGHNNEGLFVGAAGLIGLGGGSLSFPSQINASSFSYCLVDRDSDSNSTLEFDTSMPNDTITAKLLRNSKLDTFYYVDMTGISVGGVKLPISQAVFRIDGDGDGGVIIDSGTAITRLQTTAYEPLRDAFRKRTGDLPLTESVALFDTCYDLRSRKKVNVPTVSFWFSNGKELKLPAKNYLVPVDSVGTFCFAFAPTSSGLGIIGNVQQQGTRVGYDLVNSVIGFSPNKC